MRDYDTPLDLSIKREPPKPSPEKPIDYSLNNKTSIDGGVPEESLDTISQDNEQDSSVKSDEDEIPIEEQSESKRHEHLEHMRETVYRNQKQYERLNYSSEKSIQLSSEYTYRPFFTQHELDPGPLSPDGSAYIRFDLLDCEEIPGVNFVSTLPRASRFATQDDKYQPGSPVDTPPPGCLPSSVQSSIKFIVPRNKHVRRRPFESPPVYRLKPSTMFLEQVGEEKPETASTPITAKEEKELSLIRRRIDFDVPDANEEEES